jgi:branched-chain amino acid aminotransferase
MKTDERVDAREFGRVFTDHMAVIRFEDSRWGKTRIVGYEPVSLSPAASGLHYGQAIFEGLKAYRQPDGTVALFRVCDHAARFGASAERMAMPALPVEQFVQACAALVATDEAAVPTEPGHSLYLRPLMIGTTPRLGVDPASEYLCVVIASPVGAYFPGEIRPWSVMVARDRVRAAAGGTGTAKCAGNYGASLGARRAAVTAHCDEVLWLDAAEHRWIEELSAMNVFVVEHRPDTPPTVVTPPIGDTILAGITRASLLQLAGHLGYRALEAPIALDRLRCDAARGFIREAFASGTGAVVAPIGCVHDGPTTWIIGDGSPGPATLRLRAALLDLQEGRAPDPFGWRVPLPGHASSAR